VTSEDGTAYASSEYSTAFKADKAFGEDGYWCSVKSPERPIRLWFEFKEPKRVVQIKFEEEYEMSAENGYRVFGSNAVGDCGGPNSPRHFLTGAPASVFVTGKEFINRRVFHCYGIQTNRYGRSNYVSAKKLKFGFKDPVPHPCDDNNGGCSHICQKTGILLLEFCRCPRGWRLLQDRRTCRQNPHPCDVNNGGCSHTCRKIERRAFCRCPHGWRLLGNRKTCRQIFLDEGMTSHL